MNVTKSRVGAHQPATSAAATTNQKRTDMETQKFELQVWGDITITHADGTTDEDNNK